MNNIVLYRKYRPQGFSEIIGQTHVVQTLKNAISAGKVSHAYLFCGPRGSGKTSIARIFAKELGCEGIDLVEIDAASHTGVDDVRALIDGVAFAPVKSRYKIFIIDECHQLSKAASNALLKTLEEPPGHVIFILATTEAHKMLPTIISRCQRFDFKRLHLAELVKKLEFIAKKEEVSFEPAALSLIAVNARGSFRDAESLLDKCMHFARKSKSVTAKEIQELLGIVEVAQAAEFVDSIVRPASAQGSGEAKHDPKEALAKINTMAEEGVDLQEFAKTLVFYLRQMLLMKISPALVEGENLGLSKEEVETLKKQAESLPEKGIQRILELFIEAENKMKYATILQLPLELAVLDACSIA